MSDLAKLQELSCVNKVTQELENHIGIQNRDLAEYIIHLAKESKDVDSFDAALKENDADFNLSLVTTLFQLIRRMQPGGGGDAANGNGASTTTSSSSSAGGDADAADSEDAAAFPGLAIRNETDEDRAARAAKEDAEWSMQRLEKMRTETGSGGGGGGGGGGKRRRSRSRSPYRDDKRAKLSTSSSSSSAPDNYVRTVRSGDEPKIHHIYDGEISNIKDFGCFVQLTAFGRGADKREGMVHIGMIREGRVVDIKEIVKRGQRVKVKVVSIAGARMALSMKACNQETGEDLNPFVAPAPRVAGTGHAGGFDDLHSNPAAPGGNTYGGPKGRRTFEDDAPRTKRISSPELFEIKQLIASGALPASALPNRDDETGNLLHFEETQEELEIELNEVEPSFLKGQLTTSRDLSPLRITKNPDGSMQKAAVTQQALAKERRELRDQQRSSEVDALPSNLGQSWADPMAKTGSRHLAAELQNMGGAASDAVPKWKEETMGKNTSYGKVTNQTLLEQRHSLPIFPLREQLLQAIYDNDIMVVIGETGSGKTTQMTQYLAEAGYTEQGIIGCTQPRRVAAMSVAKRVAEEFGCRIGQEVGYSIRFEDCTSPETKIKYMTDGMLLRELLMAGDLARYKVVILDEAHERTISTDVLFGLLKQCLNRRRKTNNPMKLICTSATLDAEKFSTYFEDCPIFTIPGRLFPVTILYAKSAEQDYLDAALITVMQVHLSQPPGDILLFLTGKEEIDTACEILYDRMQSLGKGAPPLLVLPVYSALPSEMQTKIFDPAPPGSRKCVVATNIAEASLTIDGIYYVVDPGFCKQKVYDAKLHMDSLVVTPISQASANQRAGRAGRTGPGKCFRLYTEVAYKNEMIPSAIPEIQRTNLGNTVLTMKAMGINDLLSFDFMDAPPVQTLVTALEELYGLGALDDEGLLTRLGRKMAEFPLEPQLSKIVICSVDLGCAEEILTVAAMLTVEQIFYRPKDKQAQADQKRSRFFQTEGDHLTLLTVYQSWAHNNYSNPWCFDNFVQSRALRRCQDVRKQLCGIMDRYNLPIESCGKHWDRIRKAITSGFFKNAAKKDPQEGYKTLVEGQPVYIHPSSALFNRQPEWLVFHKLVLTSKEYLHECTTIEPKWLVEFAPNFFCASDGNKLSRRKRRERIEPLHDKYNPPNEWRLSRRKFV
jgi:ATP-dependent RNA helicase DHX8/PRP22